jgi:hypothetical protein
MQNMSTLHTRVTNDPWMLTRIARNVLNPLITFSARSAFPSLSMRTVRKAVDPEICPNVSRSTYSLTTKSRSKVLKPASSFQKKYMRCTISFKISSRV